jgi:imidazole glycerol-phosphate synthase subunit HisF
MDKRIIARIDVKNEFVIKGIQLEGLRKLGDPNGFAQKYYDQGIDEIIFMDAVAAYYDRNSLSDLIEKAVQNIFVPITVGGGIRRIGDIETALKSGADKVAINTAAINNPDFINESAHRFGSQCIVAQIDVKRIDGTYIPYFDNGREPSKLELNQWIYELEERGAGEILITSIDHEGTKLGFDENILSYLNKPVNIPLIVSGGFGKKKHCIDILKNSKVDAIALASYLHYNLGTISDLKSI